MNRAQLIRWLGEGDPEAAAARLDFTPDEFAQLVDPLPLPVCLKAHRLLLNELRSTTDTPLVCDSLSEDQMKDILTRHGYTEWMRCVFFEKDKAQFIRENHPIHVGA